MIKKAFPHAKVQLRSSGQTEHDNVIIEYDGREIYNRKIGGGKLNKHKGEDIIKTLKTMVAVEEGNAI